MKRVTFALVTLASIAAQATPVYLSPASFFPSGHYAREALAARTSNEQTQTWLRVRSMNGKVGWLPEEFTITRRGPFSPDAELRARRGDVPLRSAPLPFAKAIAMIPAGEALKRLSSTDLRWGCALMRGMSDGGRGAPALMWWPMAEGFDDDGHPIAPAHPEIFNTAAVFKRKIFDVATSASLPGLQFVSAQGLFRTTDGKSWRQAPEFKEANYPVTIAKSGTVFVGPYASFDHGETFQQFVKWDSLINSIKQAYALDPAKLQILELRALDPTGDQLRMKIEIGTADPVFATTRDQGLTWETKTPVAAMAPLMTEATQWHVPTVRH